MTKKLSYKKFKQLNDAMLIENGKELNKIQGKGLEGENSPEEYSYYCKLKDSIKDKELSDFWVIGKEKDLKPMKGYSRKQISKYVKSNSEKLSGNTISNVKLMFKSGVKESNIHKHEWIFSVIINVYPITDGELDEEDSNLLTVNYDATELLKNKFSLSELSKMIQSVVDNKISTDLTGIKHTDYHSRMSGRGSGYDSDSDDDIMFREYKTKPTSREVRPMYMKIFNEINDKNLKKYIRDEAITKTKQELKKMGIVEPQYDKDGYLSNDWDGSKAKAEEAKAKAEEAKPKPKTKLKSYKSLERKIDTAIHDFKPVSIKPKPKPKPKTKLKSYKSLECKMDREINDFKPASIKPKPKPKTIEEICDELHKVKSKDRKKIMDYISKF